MTRKVVEFLDTNMGMVEDNLGQQPGGGLGQLGGGIL